MPIIDFRNNYEKGYVDQFYGRAMVTLHSQQRATPGKPDQMRLLYKTDFKANGDAKKNIRLKWMAICLNMDYVTGKVGIRHIISFPFITLKNANISNHFEQAGFQYHIRDQNFCPPSPHLSC